MPIAVTVVTTANRTRRFIQTDENSIQAILSSLKRAGQMFSERSLIIGSDQTTEVFASSSITRIQFETTLDLAEYLPQRGETQMTLIPEGAATPPAEGSETHFAGRADFFFNGGDTVAMWISGARPAGSNERLLQLTRLFEQPMLMYKLP